MAPAHVQAFGDFTAFRRQVANGLTNDRCIFSELMNSELQKRIETLLPLGCSLEKVELEGPDLVVYINGINKFYEAENPVRDIASGVKKKIIVRSSAGNLLPPDEAKEKIKKLVPPEGGVSEIRFCDDFHEVWIEAMKPGLVIGKGGAILKDIIKQTGWAPKVLRLPTIPSEVIKGIRSSLLKEAVARKKFLSKTAKRIFTAQPKTSWVKSTALGGFKEVGRSAMFLQTSNDKILIDCGVNPDTFEPSVTYPYLSTLNIPLDEIDAVVLTHAHLDHSGFVPYLFATGYEGPVYMTPPTRDLMALLCFDYIKVMKRTGATPAYSEKDVRKAIAHTVTRDYGEVTDITPEIKLTLHNAGHILGSAMAHLHISDGLHNLVYSGDIKFGGTRLLNSAATTFPRIETLFMESTYGGRDDVTPTRIEAEQKLTRVIQETISRKGKVLIPVFSVGRSQEVMLVLEDYARRNKDFNVKVYLDGMVREASAIHTVYPEYLRDNVQRTILSGHSPFESPIFELVKGDRQEVTEGEPCVILAPSGMLSGGPSVGYLKLLAENPNNTLIFVGYQAVNTLGRKIQRGDREVATIGEDGRLESIRINMRVETCEGFSGHSDRRQLMAFARSLRPKPSHIYLMHGEESKCDDLSGTLSKILRIEARAPMNLDGIRLK